MRRCLADNSVGSVCGGDIQAVIVNELADHCLDLDISIVAHYTFRHRGDNIFRIPSHEAHKSVWSLTSTARSLTTFLTRE